MTVRTLGARSAGRVVAALIALAIAADARADALRVCLVSGSAEYDSDASLFAFTEHLEQSFDARAKLIRARGFEELPGLEALDECDVALFFTRRLTISGEALEKVKRYCDGGKPLVAVRTASHGFQNWLDMDRVVLGGSYARHAGPGKTTIASVEHSAKDHPVLEGVGGLRSRATLYQTAPLAPDCEVLLMGSIPGDKQPVAWTRTHRGGRVVYISLGAPEDFENRTFLRFLTNALHWAAKKTPSRKEAPAIAPRPRLDGTISLSLRTRVEPFRGSGEWREATTPMVLPVAETAIIICDMWDHHWCRGAEERAGAIAERMGPVIDAARKKGIQIIHAPSETLEFYAGSPARRRLAAAPPVSPPAPRTIEEAPLPIDDSDGGCDTDEKPWYPAWTRQDRRIPIAEPDVLGDRGEEIHAYLKSEGIRNLLFMGVHTNMCVLGRSFGIRQMARWGMRPILVRDLTDTLYDPRDPPHVSHDEGTERVVQHIERWWGPSVLSGDIVD